MVWAINSVSCTFVFSTFPVQTLVNVVLATRGEDAHFFSVSRTLHQRTCALGRRKAKRFKLCTAACFVKATRSSQVSRSLPRATVLSPVIVLCILLYTFSNTDTKSNKHSTSAAFFSESKALCHSARKSPLWPLGRAELSHKFVSPSLSSMLSEAERTLVFSSCTHVPRHSPWVFHLLSTEVGPILCRNPECHHRAKQCRIIVQISVGKI